MKAVTIFCFLFSVLAATSAVSAPKYSTSVTGFDFVTGKENTVELKDKKALVVIFVSALCPCSNSHISHLKKMAAADPEFQFVGIHANSDEARTDAVTYFSKVQLPFPVIEDTSAKYADEFRALKTPHAFVVLPSGELAYQGGVTSSADCEAADEEELKLFLNEALEDLKVGHAVRTPKARALGCMISRGKKRVL